MKTFRDIIDAFGGGAALAHKIGVEPVTARAWRMRNNIPPRYWEKVAEAAKSEGIRGINITSLYKLADSERAT